MHALAIGKGEILRRGKDLNLFAYGSMVTPATEAAASLTARGMDCGVINARFAKPLDVELIEQTLVLTPRLVTLEEHLVSGGLGSAVLEMAEHRRLNASSIRVHAIPDQFIDHGPQAYQRAKFRLDAAGIADAVVEMYSDFERSASRTRPRAAAAQKETVTW